MTDTVMEIRSADNALAVFEHSKKLGTENLFPQKHVWNLVKQLEELPVSHRKESVLISGSGEGPCESDQSCPNNPHLRRFLSFLPLVLPGWSRSRGTASFASRRLDGRLALCLKPFRPGRGSGPPFDSWSLSLLGPYICGRLRNWDS